MEMKKLKHLVVTILLFQSAYAQTTFYNLNTIQKIEITFTQPDWDHQLDTAKSGFDSYILAGKLKINGVEFDSVGVKYKGNSSYDATYKKNPLHIEMDTYKNQSYQGIKDIKLGNAFADPSMIREVLSYDILKNYMDCPRSNFAQVFINGVYIGLYANDESITKSFCSDHFYSSKNTFVKCNPIVKTSSNTKSALKYITADTAAYFDYYEMKSNTGWKELVALCDTITNHPASIPSIVDVDRAIWMLAFNNTMINLDSYNGVFAQNYYMYKDNTNRFNPIVWDLNMALGGFPYVGNSNSSLSGLTVTEMQKLPVTSHSADQYWPLIKNILSNAMYKKMYIAHMRTIMNEMFVSNYYKTKATQLQSIIDTAVVADTNKFYTTAQYQTAMTVGVPYGSFTIPGITTLVDGRVAYLKSTADFTNLPPVITAVKPSDTLPALNAPVAITANVTNTNTSAVYVGYRFATTDKFIRVPMEDNGANNDGTAGDNVYGAKLIMSGPQMQYYIYAENTTTGAFSPERAEHEFYTLKSGTKTADSGKVMINEFIASNKTGQVNEKGKYEDWIELYNTTASPLNLDGLHLTDTYATPAKFTFPINTIIQPHGYLLIWADENATTTSYLHCNFKLSASGEQLMLTDATNKVLDSVRFGAQPDDVSMGRCPNGSGAFAAAIPTFNASNCANGMQENEEDQAITVYPNPANEVVTIQFNNTKQRNLITFTNVLGQDVFVIQSVNKSETINIANLPAGLYFIRVNQDQFQKMEVVH
jgi:spore coat protein CotH